jgi:hypothetical protein
MLLKILRCSALKEKAKEWRNTGKQRIAKKFDSCSPEMRDRRTVILLFPTSVCQTECSSGVFRQFLHWRKRMDAMTLHAVFPGIKMMNREHAKKTSRQFFAGTSI